MAPSKIEQYFAQRQPQISLPVRLYALVDALLYARAHSSPALERSAATVALFDGTADASLADAGPWVIDVDQAPIAVRRTLFELAAGAEGVSWLISAYPFRGLAQELRERLDVRMPDGRTALLRFYDARVVGDIAGLLSFSQRAEWEAAVAELGPVLARAGAALLGGAATAGTASLSGDAAKEDSKAAPVARTLPRTSESCKKCPPEETGRSKRANHSMTPAAREYQGRITGRP